VLPTVDENDRHSVGIFGLPRRIGVDVYLGLGKADVL
jgi:hypothetical protein